MSKSVDNLPHMQSAMTPTSRGLVVIMVLVQLFSTTQCQSSSSIITLDLTTTVPESLSDLVAVTLTCNLHAQNASSTFVRLMELSICERRGKSKTATTLARINLIVPKCLKFGNNDSVEATGAIGIDNGQLKVKTSKGKDDADITDFMCVGQYLDHQFQPEMVTARKKNTAAKLFSLLADQNSKMMSLNSVTKAKVSKLEKVLANVVVANRDNKASIERLTLAIASLNDAMASLNKAKSCNELRVRRQAVAPRQQVTWPDGTTVLCDTETDGGGWTIFQRRVNGLENFARGWTDYVNGFGQLNGDFWMGLDHLHHLMKEGPLELRVDLKFNKKDYFAHYTNFKVLDDSTNYKLSIGGYSGTAGDSLRRVNNMQFSTYDADHDTWENNCGDTYSSGGWFINCFDVNLNGKWGSTKNAEGLYWKTVTGRYASATFTEMKARPVYGGL